MKRKVIQLAGKTLVVSLPQPWCRKFDINKGDEVELEERDKSIQIMTGKSTAAEQAVLDISGLDKSILRHIASLYKRGVDEIKVTFENEDDVQKVANAIAKEFVGYEIVKRSQHSCLIKNIAKGFSEEFDVILRRTFLITKEMFEELYEALEKGEFSRLNNIILIEETNNRFTTILRRSVNKEGYKDFRKSTMMYYCLEELENVADELKYICQGFNMRKKPFPKEILGLFNDMTTMYGQFYEVWYDYSKELIEAIYKNRTRIIGECNALYTKSKDGNDLLMVHYIMTITQKIFCMLAPGLGVMQG
jgi:phosphate uptake regulator